MLPTPRTTTLTIGGQLVTVTQAGGVSQPPFGVVDTPIEGASDVTGSLPVTGWALDDVGGSRVHVYRDSVAGEGGTLIYIGDATFVEGGHPVYDNFRSDIASLFPGYANSSAAVGYFILDTRTLSNGVHTIAWVVRDSLGRGRYRSRFFAIFNP